MRRDFDSVFDQQSLTTKRRAGNETGLVAQNQFGNIDRANVFRRIKRRHDRGLVDAAIARGFDDWIAIQFFDAVQQFILRCRSRQLQLHWVPFFGKKKKKKKKKKKFRVVAEKVRADLRNEIAQLKTRGVTPGLAVVLVGDNPASRAYVRRKDKMCRELGLHSVKLELPAETTQSTSSSVSRTESRSGDPWHPRAIATTDADRRAGDRSALDPAKDVDGFHPINVAKLALGDATGLSPARR